ncbi:UNVERIFIED_CONTAM: Pectin acetylesterase 11 [Sesamum radiatum]|uniref:Pectin acetylesterase n=1 Tax=Sesamum radiatum TaxID=300843 RepID=A0AAW2QEU2_SESRA
MATQVHGSDWTTITYLPTAISKGAVCLDGSPPAYYFRKGSGDGIDNWVIFLEGGGWCASNKGCLDRTKMSTGSTKLKENRHYFKDILSSNHTINPDFYNWNRIYVGYCDGSSYTGDVEEAILSGGSAGAWGTILHCDGFRELIPKASRVKCIADSGFFVHAKNLYGAKQREEYFADLIAYHCLFPENIAKDIKTPIFFIESAFDYYQLKEHNFSDDPTWKICVDNLKVCTPTQLQIMKDYRATFIKELEEVKSSSTGIFIHSCYRHGHLHEREGWDKSPKLVNKTIAEAIGDWYFDRSSFQEIDTQNELPQNCTVLS